MSALANILVDLGHEVIGVDYSKKYFTEATFRNSIVCNSFEDFELNPNYFYIIGNAFKLSEYSVKIIDGNYCYAYYPEFLESFFNMPKIGVCGSHGKTTTTCFASRLISKPINVLIGDGTGRGDLDASYFLFEACEYQNNFLKFNYEYLVVLNIDYDHPDFFSSPIEYFQAFQKAALKAQKLVYNYDDLGCRKIIHNNKISFGFNPESDVMIIQTEDQLILSFCDEKIVIDFPFVGRHLIYDFTAAFIIAYLIEEDLEKVRNMIINLKMPRRRMEEVSKGDLVLVNDYAHHPTEIRSVYMALKDKYPTKKLIAVYQPHTFSRTDKFLSDYISALKLFDSVYIMPIFSSVRENEIDKWLLLNSDNSFLMYDRKIYESIFNGENVVVFMGAGDIDSEFNFFYNKK